MPSDSSIRNGSLAWTCTPNRDLACRGAALAGAGPALGSDFQAAPTDVAFPDAPITSQLMSMLLGSARHNSRERLARL